MEFLPNPVLAVSSLRMLELSRLSGFDVIRLNQESKPSKEAFLSACAYNIVATLLPFRECDLDRAIVRPFYALTATSFSKPLP